MCFAYGTVQAFSRNAAHLNMPSNYHKLPQQAPDIRIFARHAEEIFIV